MTSEKENEMFDSKNNESLPSEQQQPELGAKDAEKEPEVELTVEEKLQKELNEKNKEIESLKDQILRVQAQASNDRKRYKQDAELSAQDTKKRVLKRMLDIRDNIDRALASFNPNDENYKIHFEGISMIATQIDDMFTDEGIVPFSAKGDMFDLLKHEVVARVPYDGPENRIIDVIQKGYNMNGKILRPAKVAISMKKQPPVQPEPAKSPEKMEQKTDPEKSAGSKSDKKEDKKTK